MALITCPDCGKEFSDAAAACPNCGRPTRSAAAVTEKKKTGCASYGCLALVVVMVVGVISSVASKSGDPGTSVATTADTDAVLRYQGQELIKHNLRDPESADFRDVVVVHKGKDIATCGSVNAKNGFGGFTGYTDFLVIGPLAVIEPPNGDNAFVTMWNRYCVRSPHRVPAPALPKAR